MTKQMISELSGQIADATVKVIRYWMVEGDKEKAYSYYKSLPLYAQALIPSGLEDVATKFGDYTGEAAVEILKLLKEREGL
jgi:hypothetical protein